MESQSGFTLIEVLVVLVLLPLVFGAVAIVIITSLRNDSGISTKLADSHDAQITSAYFVRDVQSADRIWAPTTSSTPLCGTGNQVLGLESNLNPGPAIYVSYVTEMLGTSPALVRNFCTGATRTASTVSHDLGGTSDAVTNLACTPNYPSCGTDAATAPTPSVEIATVQVTVTQQSGYQYSLTAAPRQVGFGGNGASPPGSSPPTLLLLGSGQDVNCQGGGVSGSLTVNGIAATDSATSNDVTFTGNPRYKLTGGEVYTENSSTSIGSAYTPTSATAYASGPPLPDPYANLPDPPTTGPGVNGTFNDSNIFSDGPGVYTSPVSITSDNAGNPNILPGIYIFENGISFSGNGAVTGNGVMFFIGIPNQYIQPSDAFFNNSGNGNINLTAPTSGLYTGLVIFQSRYDSDVLQIVGNGMSTTYNGVIYAPDAQVNTTGGGTNSTGGIISQSLACGGNGAVTIGSQVATTMTLTSSNSSPTSDQSLTFTAAVSATDGLIPAGSVTFSETPNGSATAVVLCSNKALAANGKATCTTSIMTESGSPYTVTAAYGGNTTFKPQTATLNQYVYTATTTTATALPSSPTTGQQVVFTAAVVPAPDSGTMAWTITYGSSGGSSGSLSCNSTTALSAGSATCTVNAGILQAANSPYTVTAVYSGDTFYATSTGTLNLVVGQSTSSTAAAATPTNNAATDTATVTGNGNGIGPTGSVTFYVCANTTTGCTSTTAGATQVGSATSLSAGQATSGSYPVTSGTSYCFAAYYSGDMNYANSSDTTADQCFTAS